MTAPLGIVVIGRNEGERLDRCLRSVAGRGPVVYVDSGSSDRSVETAREHGAQVVQLDLSVPFTAARSRNAGLRRLLELHPGVSCVQFVDGDCEIDPAWLDAALAALHADSTLAAVCGRLIERRPDASLYNRLCQLEWNQPPGPVNACGGVAAYAVAPLLSAGLFREDMIAGEEPELCFRLRAKGRRILRLDVPMATHDAAMTRLGQWLRRARRGGHAFAECFWIHRAARYRLRESARILAWGFVVPLAGAALAVLAFAWPPAWFGVGAIACLYALVLARAARDQLRRGTRPADAVLYAAFCTIAKVPEAIGIAQFAANRLRSRRTPLIEYKA